MPGNIGIETGGQGAHGPHKLYNFSIEIKILPCKSILLNLLPPAQNNVSQIPLSVRAIQILPGKVV